MITGAAIAEGDTVEIDLTTGRVMPARSPERVAQKKPACTCGHSNYAHGIAPKEACGIPKCKCKHYVALLSEKPAVEVAEEMTA